MPDKKKNILEIIREIKPPVRKELAKNIEEVYKRRKYLKLKRVEL